eukprot:symbB.v1.2.016809.t1/scaffold1292.1/size223628/7
MTVSRKGRVETDMQVAMFLLSLGIYDPRHHGLRDEKSSSKVSVICPTSEKRHAFHPLLYQNFVSQSCKEKELVVVDTGTKPSEFLLAKAAEDARVIYRYFHVNDSKENDPMSAVILDDGFSMLTGEDVKKRRGWSFKPKSGWSLGFKRNLCCHLATGLIIAHFDDDDLYTSSYLEHMCHQLGALLMGIGCMETENEREVMKTEATHLPNKSPKTPDATIGEYKKKLVIPGNG